MFPEECESEKVKVVPNVVILNVKELFFFLIFFFLIYHEFLVRDEITTQGHPASHLPDINISTYLTPGPLPSPSVSRVESADTRTDDDTDEKHVLVSLETPISSSFEGLPRHLFVSTDISTFCQSNGEDDGKMYHDDSKTFMDVYLPEVIQAQREEVVISTEEMDPIEYNSREEENMWSFAFRLSFWSNQLWLK